MIAEKLSGIYGSLEDKYYGLLDFLDAKGVPVYVYNDFLEGKGIPAFPFTVALIFMVIAAALAITLIGTAINPTISFSIENQFDESISGVLLTISDTSGRKLATKTIGDGGEVELQGIGIGATLEITAQKQGYKDATYTLDIKKEKGNFVNLELELIVESVNASLTLVDEETGDAVANAHVLGQWRQVSIDEYSDAAGLVPLNGIPRGLQINFVIETDAYETISENYSFGAGENRTLKLSPKGISLQGTSKLLISIKDQLGNAIRNANVTIRNNINDSLIIENAIAEDGEYFTDQIPKGTSIRVVVQKDGYLRYDSLIALESRTLRLEEETWSILLKQGGEKLTVLTYAEGNVPLGNVEVMLFDLENNMIDSETTGLGGTVGFTDLNGGEFYVTGWRDGYLPIRKLVNVAETETTSMVLQASDATNSVFLAIYVVDSSLGAGNSADLFFWEKQGEELLPLGIPSKRTDLTGYASVKSPVDLTVAVQGKKNLEAGWGEKNIRAGALNEIRIQLEKDVSVVELLILDEDGNPVAGEVKITSPNGDLLYEGPIIDGSVFFDAQGNERVNLEITTEDGRTYSEQAYVKDKEIVEVKLGEEQVESLAPRISFEGIFNSRDEKVDAISKGEYYWLKFRLELAAGTAKAGLHVRAGEDSVAFVDSQEIGVVGFDAITSDYKFGKSYQPTPSPGNEGIDMQNAGRAGEMNKWLELYFENPSDTVVAKVKVKAETTLLKEEVEFHYRAWIVAGASYYRSPADSELGEALFSQTKTPLYAETTVERVRVFETEEISCEEEICASYRFVEKDGVFVEPGQFKPTSGQTYALEIDLRAKEALTATLKIDTSKTNPLLFFTGHDIDSFQNLPADDEIEPLPANTDLSGQGYLSDIAIGVPDSELETNIYGFKESENKRTSITVSGISILKGQQRTVRVYFTTETPGAGRISTQAIAGNAVVNKDFSFTITKAKELELSVSPSEVDVGEDFTARVVESETGNTVGTATVHLKDKEGKLVHSIVGNNSNGRGLNGQYEFNNSFDPGIYTLEAVAEGFKPAKLELVIAQDKLLEIKPELKISIEENQKQGSVSTSLKNLSSFDIQEISYELIKPGNFPDEFYVTVDLPPSLNERQEGRVTINVEVDLGENSEESLHGELEVELKGTVGGTFPTKTKTRVIIDYNKKLDPDCLKFDKRQLRMRLIGRPGSTASDELEIENKCGEDVSLRAKVESGENDPNLQLTVSQVTIRAGKSERVRITALNKIDRLYALSKPFTFRVTFESSKVAKSLPVIVELWNPSYNLAVPPSVALWLARRESQNIAMDTRALYVTNTGQVPITSFRMALTERTIRDYPGLRVDLLPHSTSFATIAPGQPLSPSRFVHAEFAKGNPFDRPAQTFVEFNGVVLGRRYGMGRTAVAVNWQGYNCLVLEGKTAMNYASKEKYGTQFKEIKLTNNCLDSVRMRTVEPNSVQGNVLSIVPGDIVIEPKTSKDARLQLAISKETRFRTIKVKAKGLMVSSQQFIESNPLEITIDIGEKASTSEGKATVEKDIRVCGTEGTKKVAFPKLSSECSQGYCDAKQAAQFIAKEINNTIKRAKQKIYRGQNNAGNFPGCKDKSQCTFSSMGVSLQPMTIFMQLDYMGPQVLLTEMQKGNFDELKSFSNVAQGTKSLEGDNSSDLSGFDYGVVHLGGTFKGCGKYYVKIDGAAQVINNEIQLEGQSMIITVNLIKDRVVTPECENAVQNVPNFLPLDEGYTKNSSEIWPGLVLVETNKLEKAAKTFAKTLFKAEEERIVNSRQNNNLKLVLGQVDGGLMKISVEGAGNSDEPKLVIVHIADIAESEIDKVAKEAAEAVSALKSGIVKGCIDPNDPSLYFIIEETEFIDKLYGKLEIVSDQEAVKINTQEKCIDFNVTRSVADTVKFRTDFAETVKGKSKTGIEAVRIRDRKGNLVREELVNGTVSKDGQVKLAQPKKRGGEVDKKKLFIAQMKLCVDGDNFFALAPENTSQVKVWATSTNTKIANRETDPPLEVKIQACGIHPYDLFEKLAGKKPGTYYATIGWRAPPDKIRLQDILRALQEKKVFDHLDKIVTSKEGISPALDQQKVWRDEMSSSRLSGIAWWTVSCSVADGIASSTKYLGAGALAAAINVFADCIVPGGYMAMQETDWGRRVSSAVAGFFGGIVDWFSGEYDPDKITQQGAGEGNSTKARLNRSYEELKEEQEKWLAGSGLGYLKAGAISGGVRRIGVFGSAAIEGGGMIRSARAATKAADAYAKYLGEETAKKMFSKTANPALYKTAVADLTAKFRAPLRTEFADAVARGGAQSIDDLTAIATIRAIPQVVDDLPSTFINTIRGSGTPASAILPDSEIGRMLQAGGIVDTSDLARASGQMGDNLIGEISNTAGGSYTGNIHYKPDLSGTGTPLLQTGSNPAFANPLANDAVDALKINLGPDKFDDLVTKAGYTGATGEARETAFRAALRTQMQKETRQIAKGIGPTIGQVPDAIPAGTIINPATGQPYAQAMQGTKNVVTGPAAMTADDSVTAVKRALKNLDTPSGAKLASTYADDAIDDIVKLGIRDVARETAEAGTTALAKSVPPGKIASILKGLFTWNFLKSLLKGVGVAGAGQLGGYIGSRIYWEGIFEDPVANPEVGKLGISTGVTGDGKDNDNDGSIDEEVCDGVDNDGDKLVDEDCGDTFDRDLHNGMTYRIDIEERGPHNITWDIKKVVEGGGPLGFDTMDRLLREEKATVIEGDCDGKFAQRGVQEIFGPYIISPENAKFVGLDNALFYLKPVNNEIILNAADSHKLGLAELLAAIFESNAHRKPDVKEQVNLVAEELSKTDLERFAKAHKLDPKTVKKTAENWSKLPTIAKE